MARLGYIGVAHQQSPAIFLTLLTGCTRRIQIFPAALWVHDGVARSCRIYLEESLRTNDAFTDQLEDDVADMRTILGLGTREAADMRSEIVSKSYKCALPQPVAPLYSIGAVNVSLPVKVLKLFLFAAGTPLC